MENYINSNHNYKSEVKFLNNENIDKLFKILNVIMKYIDSLMKDLNKIEHLYKIIDKLNKIAGEQLQSIVFHKNYFK